MGRPQLSYRTRLMVLARSGRYADLAQIRRQLQAEGFPAQELHSATLRNQVMDEIDMARTSRHAVRAVASFSPSA